MNKIQNKETYEDVVKVLIERGWKKCKHRFSIQHESEFWAKRYPGVPRCAGNSDKEGILLVIYVYEHEGRVSYEIELCGEKADGAWIKLLAYAWEGGLLEVMDSQISQLLDGWTVFAKGNPV